MPPTPRRSTPSVAVVSRQAGPAAALMLAAAGSLARACASASPRLAAAVLPEARTRAVDPYISSNPDADPRRVPTPLLIARNSPSRRTDRDHHTARRGPGAALPRSPDGSDHRTHGFASRTSLR